MHELCRRAGSRCSSASPNQFAPLPESLPGAAAAKRPKKGSNDYGDYNDNGVAKPERSLISRIIAGGARLRV